MEKMTLLQILNEIPTSKRPALIGAIGEEYAIAKYKKMGYSVNRIIEVSPLSTIEIGSPILHIGAVIKKRRLFRFRHLDDKRTDEEIIEDHTAFDEGWRQYPPILTHHREVWDKNTDEDVSVPDCLDDSLFINIASRINGNREAIMFAEKTVNGDIVGFPDLYVEKGDDFFFVEVKTTCNLERITKNRGGETSLENLLRPNQLEVKKWLEKLGFRYVIDVVEYEAF
ncbi:MAG TPA: hypothetical protein VJH04_03520 [archaeon]|nr:hypothetical protein [archaeon]